MDSHSQSDRNDNTTVVDKVTVTHIDDIPLPQPLIARAIFEFYPKIQFFLKFDHFIASYINKTTNDVIKIKIENGIELEGFIQYSLNDLFHAQDVIEVKFHMQFGPLTVIHQSKQIKSLKFGVINFTQFLGKPGKIIRSRKEIRRIGVLEAIWDGFEININEQSDFSENKLTKGYGDSYFVSHEGTIKRSDGAMLSVSDAETILYRLRGFFSFTRGRACALAPVTAVNRDDTEECFRWGTTYVISWMRGNDTWLTKTTGGDALAQILSEFLDLYDRQNWKDVMPVVVDWYINGNDSAAHVAIILYQAALEALCLAITGSGWSAGSSLRDSMSKLSVDKTIPSTFRYLRMFSQNQIMNKKSGDYIGDGPEVLVQIRNDLIHGGKKYGPPSMQVQVEAMNLARWYIEVLLLKQLGYTGNYFNRINRNIESIT